jgi:hypothetical protein
MSGPKRTAGTPHHPPASGQADVGAPFDPASMVPEPGDPSTRQPPQDRAMPAPRSPLPAREVERLKARAAKTRAVVPATGQHDPGVKKPPK